MFGFWKTKRKFPVQAEAGTPSMLPATAAVGSAAPVGTMPYCAGLIEELVADHAALRALEARIRRAFLRNDLTRVAKRLREFGTLLRGHILKENVRLYAFLQRIIEDDAEIETIKHFRREMNGLSQSLLAFFKQYESIDQLPPEQAAGFLADLDALSWVVHDRMQREERQLYPLYRGSAVAA